MDFVKEDIETLTGLGLTSLQAKIYLTLCRTGQTDIRNLAKNAEVARQEASRATEELQNLGLILKVISRPTTYKPFPLNDSTEMLLDWRVQKTDILREKRERLLKRVKARQVNCFDARKPEFLVFPGGEGGVRQSVRILDHVKSRYEGIFFLEAVLKMPFEIQQSFESFLQRGGKMCVIVTKAENNGSLQKFAQFLKSKGSFEIRNTSKKILAPLAIHDRKELICTTNLKTIPQKSNSFYSNSPILVGLAVNYFKQSWSESEDI